MSTILETLKKLEEDKKFLERNLDLKELVLQEDQRLTTRLAIPYKIFITASLALAIIIIVVLIFSKQPHSENTGINFTSVPSEQKIVSIERKPPEPTVGIPLSKIPEQRPLYKEKVSKNLLTAKKEPILEYSEPDAVLELSEINEIRDLIQTATSEADQPQLNPYPEELVSRGISIPNLKVKGIIFFSSGSPSNYIFVSMPESKNHKVRVGDTIQSATLMHIESNRVVFSYQNETVHLGIGE